MYEILASRASKSLEQRSLHRNAATYIASATQNAALALAWLRTAAQHADDTVTKKLVRDTRQEAYEHYTEDRLSALSQHHRHLHETIQELVDEDGPIVQTGRIYTRYQKLTEEQGVEPVSNRRASDYLKQLEQLNLITVKYHYGGSKGKTREIGLER